MHTAPQPLAIDQAWAWLEPQLPRFGITRVADVTGLDELGLPVSVAVRPLSRALSVSQGKGLTAEHARVSAAMESIETWHAERICAPLYQGNAEQARADGLNLLDPAAFAHRATAVAPAAISTAYIEVQRWGRDETAWVPFDCVSTDFCFDDDDPPVWMRTSNGLAAGSTREQALSHAVAELVERDTVQRWLADEGFEAPAFALQPGTAPRLDGLLARCEAAGLVTLVWPLAGPLPCYAVQLIGRAGRARDVGAFSGYGCHSQAMLALEAALLEAVQSRLTLISGARDDMLLDEFERCRNDAWVEGLLARHAHAPALPLPTGGEPMDAHALVCHVEAALQRPLYWLDLTRADIGIPVVRALMPGLRTLGMERRYYCLREAQP